ncbi:GIY-YIG domain-containing protein, putative endonuclease [Leptolyngbyaceae cyanobacterium JSC-12]|nr:GIY-YIG domain-containing protein, putative endonuclease [Leptolyngbyaceae cyanobacterium JSC-12]
MDIYCINEVNITELPKVAVSNRSNLPEVAGVYFVLGRTEILYIGMSTNIKDRWRRHHKLEFLVDKRDVHIAWLEASTNGLRELENKLINKYDPILNGSLNCGPDEELETLKDKLRELKLEKINYLINEITIRLKDPVRKGIRVLAEFAADSNYKKEVKEPTTDDFGLLLTFAQLNRNIRELSDAIEGQKSVLKEISKIAKELTEIVNWKEAAYNLNNLVESNRNDLTTMKKLSILIADHPELRNFLTEENKKEFNE